MESLKGKNILVTGATSGIGRSLALKLSAAGANLAICGRSQQKMESLVKEISAGSAALIYSESFDLLDQQRIFSFVDNAHRTLGDFDILVNCAGANPAKGRIPEINVEDLEWMLKVKLVAPFLFMQEVYKRMRNLEQGMILNVMSTVCKFSNEDVASYTASKAGFDALAKVFRKEARAKGLRVCSIYPGGVDTPFRDIKKPEYLNSEEVADAIVMMLLQRPGASVDELVIRPMIEKNFS
ncbi:MAG: SDR family oxidoreductase [Spirochaetales bacterium]|nr:SDR family oxidoreductase [Spirochaetales bacterium]